MLNKRIPRPPLLTGSNNVDTSQSRVIKIEKLIYPGIPDIDIEESDADNDMFVTFVKNIGDQQQVRVNTNGITYNPHTDTLTASTFVGDLHGTSDMLNIVEDNTTSLKYIPYVTGDGSQEVYVSPQLTYNPLTNYLSVHVDQANTLTMTNDSISDEHFPVLFTSSDGYNTLLSDPSKFYYNPSTETLTVGSITGTAATVNVQSSDDEGLITFVDTIGDQVLHRTFKCDKCSIVWNCDKNVIRG